MSAFYPYPYATHLARLRAPDAWRETRGEGVLVAILDTGLSTGHPWLASALKGPLLAGRADLDPRDDAGHGTLCAGLVAGRHGTQVIGMAPGCNVTSIRVANRDKFVLPGAYAGALKALTELDPHVVSISMASETISDEDRAAFDAFVKRGRAILFAASGNRAAPPPLYPAALPGVFGVGALTWSGKPLYALPAPSTWIRFAALGESLWTAGRAGGLDVLGGTSAATALVAGASALALGLAPDEARRRSMIARLPDLLAPEGSPEGPIALDLPAFLARTKDFLSRGELA
jgi:membrane-anchored mycosin MYCP